ILSYRAAMNSLGRVEIEVAEIRWDGKTNEFVVKAYLDKIVARAIQEGIMSGELSVQAYGIDGDSFATKHTFGSYSFPGSHGPWKSPPMPRPSRSVLTETIRLHASARSEGYKEFLPSRVALRFVTSRGEALGEYVELHNTSRITLWSREDGKLRVSRRTK
ncbi:MAG: hypothetical protein O7H41_18305, partial [Planctomycetota bacterium]|nr:hypothetical protein [Planctomycetota bacterium]